MKNKRTPRRIGTITILAAIFLGIWLAERNLWVFSKKNNQASEHSVPAENAALNKDASQNRTYSSATTALRSSVVMSPSLALIRAAITSTRDLFLLRQQLGTMESVSTQDRAYYRAAIDEYCYGVAANNGWIKGDKAFLVAAATIAETSRDQVISQNGDPKQAAREQARVGLASKAGEIVCAGYKTNPLTLDDIKRNWAAAAATGDARSIASLSDLVLRQSSRPWRELDDAKIIGAAPDKGFLMTPDPTSDHIGKLTSALSAGDPSAIISLGPTLGQTFENGQFVFGSAGEVLQPGLKRDLWPLLACEFGYNCGADSTLLQSACANQGLCEMPNLETYFKSYRLTVQEVEQYERLKPQFLNAIQTGDWSFIHYQSPRQTVGNNFIAPFRVPFKLGR